MFTHEEMLVIVFTFSRTVYAIGNTSSIFILLRSSMNQFEYLASIVNTVETPDDDDVLLFIFRHPRDFKSMASRRRSLVCEPIRLSLHFGRGLFVVPSDAGHARGPPAHTAHVFTTTEVRYTCCGVGFKFPKSSK